MNLVDLTTRSDKYVLSACRSAAQADHVWQDTHWRSLKVDCCDEPQLEFSNIAAIHALQSMPSEIGWYACARKGWLRVVLEGGGHRAERRITLGEVPVPVSLPWGAVPGFLNPSTRLSLHFELVDGEHGQLLIHRKLRRDVVIQQATGQGVEIGPGTNPQIHGSDSVSVSYVEEMPAEKWAELYDKKGRYNSGAADFSRYIIGTAWDLPVSDESIDFVFSSHVFEHLANPIGHLLQWQRKLRPKGKVIAVVPDARATKDYMMPPCSLDELLDEQARGITAPESRHYQRYGVARRSARLAAASEAEKASIHVHFYVPDSMALLLRHCVQEHGFSDYSIVQSRNHKDFYFVLEAR